MCFYSPFEEDAETPVGREKPPLNVVELVEVLKEKGDPVGVAGRGPHGLPDVHELRDGVLVVVAVLGVVFQDEVFEGVAKVDLLRLLQAQGDHRDLGSVPGTKLGKKFIEVCL